MEPSRAQIQTSAAPASKYKVRFSLISEGELEGERISTQISGARVSNCGFHDLWAVGSEPSDVDSLDAISGGQRALCQDQAMRKQIRQKNGDGTLPAGMAKGWRRAHKDVAVAIGLNAIRELRKGWIRQDFGPTLEVELGLRNALR